MSQPARGLDIQVSVQLVDEHEVDVELLAVELQAQVSESLHLQEGAFQGLHGRHLRSASLSLVILSHAFQAS